MVKDQGQPIIPLIRNGMPLESQAWEKMPCLRGSTFSCFRTCAGYAMPCIIHMHLVFFSPTQVRLFSANLDQELFLTDQGQDCFISTQTKIIFGQLRLRLFSANLNQTYFWSTLVGLFLIDLGQGCFWSSSTRVDFGQPWLALFAWVRLGLILTTSTRLILVDPSQG